MRRLHLTRLEGRAVPAVVTWDGGPDDGSPFTDNLWTTAANWVGDVAPQPGDDLVFPGGARQLTANNDFAFATAFRSLAVTGGGYVILGNAIAVTDGVTADIGIGIEGTSELALPNNGSGGLTKSGDGVLVLSAANAYVGLTTVNAGTLRVRNDLSLGAAGADDGTIVGAGAALDLDADGLNVGEAIALAGGATVILNGAFVSATLSGTLTLAGDGFINVSQLGSTLTLAGGVAEAGGSRNLTLNGAGGVVFAAGTVNAVTGTTAVNATATFNGTGPLGAIRTGPTGGIFGSGSVGPFQIDVGSFLSPGGLTGSQSIGTLTTTGLSLPSSTTSNFALVMDLTPTGVDRLAVNGPVRVGGTLTPSFLFDFAPTPGGRYRLIDNDGTDAVAGTFLQRPEGAVVAGFGDLVLRITYRGGDGNDVELFADSAAGLRRFAVGAGPGGVPVVSVFDATGSLVRSFLAYDAGFLGGVNVAVADITGDGVPDVVTGPGFGGGPVVRVFDGVTGAMVRQFLAYDAAFRGGVNVGTGFTNVDGFADIITGAGRTGGPHVKTFDGQTGVPVLSFFAYDTNFRGGVSVAGGNGTTVSHGGTVDPGTIITGAGVGGGPHVRVFNNVTGLPTGQQFLAYEAAFTGGINVAYFAAGGGTIVTAPKAGGGPVVRGFSPDGAFRFQFLAYDVNFRGGTSVAVQTLGAPNGPSIVTGPGTGMPSTVRVWNDNGTTLARSFNAFDPAFQGGVFVG